MSWSEPITWTFGQPLSASVMNQEIRDNLIYLKRRPIDLFEYMSGDFTVPTDASVFSYLTGFEVSLIVEGYADLLVTASFSARSNVANAGVFFDIYHVEENVFLSTGTSSTTTYGLGGVNTPTGATAHAVNLTRYVLNKTGTNTFRLYGRTALTATGIIIGASNSQFSLREL